MNLNARLVLKRRKQIGGGRRQALLFASVVILPVLAGCSASTDSVFGSSRSATAPAVGTPPPSNVSAEIAGQPGATVPPAPATYASNASVSPVPPAPATYASNASVSPVPPAPAPYGANAPVAAPATYGANASVPPDMSPDRPAAPPAENPFYSLFKSLKDGTEECSLPSEPCDNNHRVQN